MKIKVKKDKIRLYAKIYPIGNDLLIAIFGGDKPHVGSALLVNKNELKSISLKSHKDHFALEIIAKILKKHTKKNIALVGGIHIENISKKQINQVLTLSEKLAYKLLKKL